MKKIIFLGNCQVQAIYDLYLRFAAQAVDQQVRYVRSYEGLTDVDRTALEQADLIVEQIQEFQASATVPGVAPDAARIGVPVVHGGFLWPFAGQPHPHNPHLPYLESGPYDAEISDSFLNRLIKNKTDPDKAVALYLALDVNQTVQLDRLLEVVLEKQAARDAVTGFAIAPIIASYFRTERLFLTPYHPDVRIALALAEQTFQRLGVSDGDVALMRRAIRVTPFPKNENPVHPAIAGHFGLTWVTPDRRYKFLNEGSFSFAEFARRYMFCYWNEPLEAGLALSRENKLAEARERLRAALTLSPKAAAAHSGLAHVLFHCNTLKEALPHASRAVELEPEWPAYRVLLGQVRERAGDFAAAEREFSAAVALDPFDAHHSGLLAGFLLRQNRAAESVAVATQGLACAPRAANLLSAIGHAQLRLGDAAAAAAAFRHEAALAPGSASPHLVLAELAEQAGDSAAAIAHLQSALNLQAAAPDVVERLATALEQAGRLPEAIAALQKIPQTSPDTIYLQSRLADLYLRTGDLHAAESAYQSVIERDPSRAHDFGQLGHVLTSQGRHAEAITARYEALRLDSNPHRRVMLAHSLMAAGDLEGAETAVRAAITEQPDVANFHLDLADILDRLERPSDALAACQHARVLAPVAVQPQAYLAHLYRKAKNWVDAEAAYRRAIDCDPTNIQVRLQFSDFLASQGRIDDARAAVEAALTVDPNDAEAQRQRDQLVHRPAAE
jgi:tetratricopeptide (TPR) repeat protein